VPSIFVPLDELPKAPNGKVALGALPPPDTARPPLDCPFVAARTPVEEGLSRIWAEVVGVAPVGVLDNFFDLGGTSLRATQVVARLRDAFGVDVPIRVLFDAPTVEGLALAVVCALSDSSAGDELLGSLREIERQQTS
jgi:hypothetical protein